jgi:hypothetical protein
LSGVAILGGTEVLLYDVKNGHKKLATLPIPKEKLSAYGEGM